MAQSSGFKQEQRRYQRVRQAYANQQSWLDQTLASQNLSASNLRIYLRAFKAEDELEVWAKKKTDDTYRHLVTFPICSKSGQIGPKRRQGDLQVPEGYYHIDRFNPVSNFHLSLGINYPNRSDKILSDKSRPGGDIFIHGSCVTIGCLPITDPLIEQLYVLCIEAKNSGQGNIPVTLFPSRLEDETLKALQSEHAGETDKLNLWLDLKKGYDYFNTHKKLPSIGFLPTGRHSVG
ncbi:hypothetical protein KFE98_09500 [bacterium SCSIO 12741]|nr:hypothetical protein KFE98_09500 [bacterium SCSIO 12741]